MIYLKRFCFCLISILCIVIGLAGTLIETCTYPIWGTIGYIITGKDLMDYLELSYSWKWSLEFLDWYEKSKFGPNDD